MTRHKTWALIFVLSIALCVAQNPHTHSPSHPGDAHAHAHGHGHHGAPSGHAHGHGHHGRAVKLVKWKTVAPKREPARFVEGELAFDQVGE